MFTIQSRNKYNEYRYRSFLPEGDSIQPNGSNIEYEYEPFQFLQHVTDLHAARNILQWELFKVFEDNMVFLYKEWPGKERNNRQWNCFFLCNEGR